MITDSTLAGICSETYAEGSVWTQSWEEKEIHVGIRQIEGVTVVAFRGSISLTDWLRDFEGAPVKHPQLGWVHGGFMMYMDLVLEETLPFLTDKVVVTGHSLGAARASLYAALLAVELPGKLFARVVFGEPRPGFQQHADILVNSTATLRSYRNRKDPVPDVPELFGRYTRASQLLAIDVEPNIGDLSPLHDHHIGLYCRGAPTTVVVP